MKNILVIGGAGYIGSRLRQVLSETYNVDSVDCCWYNYDATSRRTDFHNLTKEELAKYNSIILLAGHSSVKSCDGPMDSPWLNNVTNFTELLNKTTPEQQIIYASSASVYGNNSTGQLYTEEITQFVPVNNYDITKYELDKLAQTAIDSGRNVIGLRFGTVNGYSPNLRTDVMINAMIHTAQTQGNIIVMNKHIGRAILGLEDLCRAIDQCIIQRHAGIYNLASFNLTVGEIANAVGNRIDIPVIDKGNTPNAYDFGLDCTLFKNTFGFTFNETPDIIVDRLVEKYDWSKCTDRNKYMIYNWEKENGSRTRKRIT